MLIIDYIGVFGPIILSLLTLLLLYYKNYTYYSLLFIIGSILNIMLNIILKFIIKEPRPKEDTNLFNLKKLAGNRISLDKFGMPSGHAQEVFFNTVFVHLVLNDNRITLFYLIISLITCYQRFKYNNHTIVQLLIGSIIGVFAGYLLYKIAKSWIQQTKI
jgi:membrane-associated phospholipid phosphatase